MAVMCDTAGNKHHICIRDNLFNCPQTQQHIHLKVKKNTYSSVLFENAFCEKKLPLTENLRITSLTCFKH